MLGIFKCKAVYAFVKELWNIMKITDSTAYAEVMAIR